MVTIILVYIAGLLFAHSMLRIEHDADNKPWTKGARLLTFALCLLSWLIVVVELINAWISMISLTGYWGRPVKSVESITPPVNAEPK